MVSLWVDPMGARRGVRGFRVTSSPGRKLATAPSGVAIGADGCSEGLPGHIFDDDERWLLWRCLRDDSLSLRLRVAGAIALLYGQIPARIVELTTGSITTSGSDTYLALRDHPVLLPPPLAALITQLVAHNSRWQATTSGAETLAWLFPGARIGLHLGHGRLTLLLNREIGVFVRPARGGALCALGGRSAGSGARRGPRAVGQRRHGLGGGHCARRGPLPRSPHRQAAAARRRYRADSRLSGTSMSVPATTVGPVTAPNELEW